MRGIDIRKPPRGEESLKIVDGVSTKSALKRAVANIAVLGAEERLEFALVLINKGPEGHPLA